MQNLDDGDGDISKLRQAHEDSFLAAIHQAPTPVLRRAVIGPHMLSATLHQRFPHYHASRYPAVAPGQALVVYVRAHSSIVKVFVWENFPVQDSAIIRVLHGIGQIDVCVTSEDRELPKVFGIHARWNIVLEEGKHICSIFGSVGWNHTPGPYAVAFAHKLLPTLITLATRRKRKKDPVMLDGRPMTEEELHASTGESSDGPGNPLGDVPMDVPEREGGGGEVGGRAEPDPSYVQLGGRLWGPLPVGWTAVYEPSRGDIILSFRPGRGIPARGSSEAPTQGGQP